MDGVKIVKEHKASTPFGQPSDIVMELDISGKQVFFLSRHGRGHRLLPSEVPYRANIHALKQLGVTNLLSVSAVGIMQEQINPGDLIVPDQIYDRTKGIRESTFYGEGCAGHVTFADPFCSAFSKVISESATACGATVHNGGTYVCIEGPQFSTRAESKSYRNGQSPVVIGMTAIPEAKLAREAELCYSMLALATDYDCWHETEADVSVAAVLAVLKANSALANRVICKTSELVTKVKACQCNRAAQYACITDPAVIPQATKERLRTLYGKYWQ
jgi:5'-methylthioadenosine phosphorylase